MDPPTKDVVEMIYALHEKEIDRLKQSHDSEIERSNAQMIRMFDQFKEYHKEEIDRFKQSHREEIENLKQGE